MDEKLRNMTSIYNKRGSNAIAFPAAWQCCEDTWVGLREAILKRMNETTPKHVY